MTVSKEGCSNIIIQDHEEDLNVWLKTHTIMILVSQSNSGWTASFNRATAIHVEATTPGPRPGETPLQAVQYLADWLFGCKFSRTEPLGVVPRFTQESIARAVARAQHTDPKKVVL